MGGSSGAIRQRKKANLSPYRSCSSLAQFPLCSSLPKALLGCLEDFPAVSKVCQSHKFCHITLPCIL
jgi:hypothetical protein